MSLLLDALKQAEKNKSESTFSALKEGENYSEKVANKPSEKIQPENTNSHTGHSENLSKPGTPNAVDANEFDPVGSELELVPEVELSINDVANLEITADSLNLDADTPNIAEETIESISETLEKSVSDEAVEHQRQSGSVAEKTFEKNSQHTLTNSEQATTANTEKTLTYPADAASIVSVSQAPKKKIYYALALLFAILAIVAYLYSLTLPAALSPQPILESDIDLIVDSIPQKQVSEQKQSDQGTKADTRSASVNPVKPDQPIAKQNKIITDVKENIIAADATEFIVEPESPTIHYPQAIKVKVKRSLPQVDLYLKQAYAAYKKSDLTAAELLYHRALQLDISNIDALLGLAVIKEHYGDLPRAQVFFEKILKLDANNPYARNALIKLKNSQNTTSQESQLKLLLEKFPNDAQSYFALANLYAAKQRWSEAQEAYFKAADLDPENADYQYNLAVSLDHLSKKTIALRYYRQALRVGQNSTPNFNKAAAEYRIQQLQENAP